MANNCSEDIRDKAKIICNKNQISSDDYMDLADNIIDNIGKEKFNEIIKANMEFGTTSSNEQMKSITKVIKTHLTTNFDRMIELAYKSADMSILDFRTNMPSYVESCFLDDLGNMSAHSIPRVYHLHADLTNGLYVLGRNSYKTLYDSHEHPIYRLLQNHYCSNSIVFIGFSFLDIYIDKAFKHIKKMSDREFEANTELYREHLGRNSSTRKCQHFLFTPSDSPLITNIKRKDKSKVKSFIERITLFHENFNEINIYPIIYKKHQHVFIQEVFTFLSQRKI